MKNIVRQICFTVTITLLVATPVLAASKTSSNSKAKSKSKTTSKRCDTNYSACVPVASDVDCYGRGGNGPKYLKGTAKVLKKDIYRLDADKDKTACEK